MLHAGSLRPLEKTRVFGMTPLLRTKNLTAPLPVRRGLLQPEAFCNQPLQSRFVEKVVGQFFIGEHGEGRALGSRSKF